MKANKFNFILAVIFIVSISLGCNFLNKTSTNDEISTKTENGQESSETEDAGLGNIKIEIEDEDSESEETENPEQNDEESGGNQTKIVKFARGKTSRSYSDAVIRATSNTYILGANQGQNMSVSISSTEDNGVFRIIAPNGQQLAGNEENGVKSFNQTLPADGKYKIIVTPTRGNATYKINFAVSAKENSETVETNGGLTTVVKFRKGGTSASYSNAVIRGERNTYILGANGGQTMSVSINSVEANAVFDVIAPNGRTLANETTNWSGELPINGKYKIIVGGTRGNATYRVNFAIR